VEFRRPFFWNQGDEDRNLKGLAVVKYLGEFWSLGVDFGKVVAKDLQGKLIDSIYDNLHAFWTVQQEYESDASPQEDWLLFIDRVEVVEVDFDRDDVIEESLSELTFVWTVLYIIDDRYFEAVIPFTSASLDDMPYHAANDICSRYTEKYHCCV